MIAKVLPIKSPSHLEESAIYIGDETHPDHLHLKKIETYHVGGNTDNDLVLAGIKAGARRPGRGRPVSNLGYTLILQGLGKMTTEEAHEMVGVYCHEFGIATAKVGLHYHPDFDPAKPVVKANGKPEKNYGGLDIHLVFANRNQAGKAIRAHRGASLKNRAKAIGNRLERDFNTRRRAMGLPELTTVRKARALHADMLGRGRGGLAGVIVRGCRAIGLDPLVEWSKALDHLPDFLLAKKEGVVTRHQRGATVSVKWASRLKAKKYQYRELRTAVRNYMLDYPLDLVPNLPPPLPPVPMVPTPASKRGGHASNANDADSMPDFAIRQKEKPEEEIFAPVAKKPVAQVPPGQTEHELVMAKKLRNKEARQKEAAEIKAFRLLKKQIAKIVAQRRWGSLEERHNAVFAAAKISCDADAMEAEFQRYNGIKRLSKTSLWSEKELTGDFDKAAVRRGLLPEALAGKLVADATLPSGKINQTAYDRNLEKLLGGGGGGGGGWTPTKNKGKDDFEF